MIFWNPSCSSLEEHLYKLSGHPIQEAQITLLHVFEYYRCICLNIIAQLYNEL